MLVKNVHSRFSDKLVDLSALKSENKSFDYACVSVSREEGESLSSLIEEKSYRETIEIGCALGVSSLYICDALAKFDNVSHTISTPTK